MFLLQLRWALYIMWSAAVVSILLHLSWPAIGQSVGNHTGMASMLSLPPTCATNDGRDSSEFSPSLYSENYRPQIHYSPTSGFMNDPNGLSRAGGLWHMYFQYNPVPGLFKPIWGHATSKDLFHWQQHRPALGQQVDYESYFSGSMVLDVKNTSGFFNDSRAPESRFVAIYTQHTESRETQCIAYSDDGHNFTKYTENPVLDLSLKDFRDPKVIWDAKRERWVMSVAIPQKHQVGFFVSKNLRRWESASFFEPAGVLGFQFECPLLEKVPIVGGEKDGLSAWALIISQNPGGPLGGSFVQAFIGDWNGTQFTPWDNSVQLLDAGKEFYAAQTFYNAPDGDVVLVGWASNWQYGLEAPTSPWRSVMTIPRKLVIRSVDINPSRQQYKLTMEPHNWDKLKKRLLFSQTGLIAAAVNLSIPLTGDGAFEIIAHYSYPSDALSGFETFQSEFQIKTPNPGEHLKVGVEVSEQQALFYVDRRFAGRAWADNVPTFTDRFSQPAQSTKLVASARSEIKMQLIVDRSISELFAQDGAVTATVLHYWDNEARPSELSVNIKDCLPESLRLERLEVRAIESTWPKCS